MNATLPTRLRFHWCAFRAGLVAAALSVAASGCVVQDERPMLPVVAKKATAEIPQDELLDVGVHIFDANVPEDEKEQEAKRIFPDVRKAESRYMPVMLRDTLEGTGQWGQVRVLPSDSASSDVNVDGRILESTGRQLKLAIRATDATGRVWLDKEYEGRADVRAYKDVAVKPRDPFDNVYATIANDLLVAREELTRGERVQVHQVAQLRFAADLAPYAFKPYLDRDQRRGTYTLTRLPAPEDPVVQRLDRVRERDYSLVDTLNEHYTNFSESMDDASGNWRKYSHEELEAEADAKRKALTRQVLDNQQTSAKVDTAVGRELRIEGRLLASGEAYAGYRGCCVFATDVQLGTGAGDGDGAGGLGHRSGGTAAVAHAEDGVGVAEVDRAAVDIDVAARVAGRDRDVVAGQGGVHVEGDVDLRGPAEVQRAVAEQRVGRVVAGVAADVEAGGGQRAAGHRVRAGAAAGPDVDGGVGRP